ncbi:MAG: hypothetical protein E6J90_33080 [Deltaproteobacteria bacterium]|nr:MAG: hypothetical protein E6J90_33080 [Deltaproteobacteria bacterium]TMQ18024.1 MAG: hypothetical protein E6J91_08880 [Deltaproteobacteria bacterium]
MVVIAIEPRGADLGAVTAETRSAAELASIGGYIAQVWTWRGGEAIVVREWSSLRYYERWVVVVRRGLRRGAPQRVHAGSIAAALNALRIQYRIKSARHRPSPPEPSSLAGRRRLLLRAIHRRGNTWRTLRARTA